MLLPQLYASRFLTAAYARGVIGARWKIALDILIP